MQFSLSENHFAFAFVAVSDFIVVVKVQFLFAFAVFFIPYRTCQRENNISMWYIIVTEFHMLFITHR